jgi:hypothetical protein
MFGDFMNVDDVPNLFPQGIFDTLLGGVYDFYGVDGDTFCIGTGSTRIALEAVEDPSDGYRSYFGCFRTSEVGKIFFRNPIARVRLEEGGESRRMGPEASESSKKLNFSGWVLLDVDTGHVWLQVGTDHGDDYYPCYTFDYRIPGKKT